MSFPSAPQYDPARRPGAYPPPAPPPPQYGAPPPPAAPLGAAAHGHYHREHGGYDGGYAGDEDGYDDEPYDDEPRRRGHAHGHSHAHGGSSAEVSRRTVRIVTAVVVPCVVLTLLAMIFLWPGAAPTVAPTGPTEQRAYADVLSIAETPCPPTSSGAPAQGACGHATVHITDGPGAGSTVTVDLPQGPGAPRLAKGDAIVLAHDVVPGASAYAVLDHQRGRSMLYMLALCAAVIVAFGRWRGLTALVGLGVSFALLLAFIIPAILDGEPPLLVAIVGSAAIMFAVLYLTHGVNLETSVAILGTLGSLIVTGLLATAFTATTKLTGFGSEETLYLSILQGNVDMRGLLLAGVIIGALGVLDDVTVTQAATVAELAQGHTSRWELYRAATRIGRAHVASAVNTIVLAYAGASLPLLLLVIAGGRDVSDLLTGENLAQEIMRSAVGTFGLVAAVPITTALATLVADLRPRRPRRRGSAAS